MEAGGGRGNPLAVRKTLALSLSKLPSTLSRTDAKRRWLTNRAMLRLAAVTARRGAATRPARFLASAKHAAKARAPERDLSSRQLFAALGLRTFSREELRQRFDAADADADGYLTRHEAAELFGGALDVEADRKAAARAVLRRLDKDQDNRVSWDEFQSTILEEASRRDKRIWPLAGTMFLGGLSVGAVMPIMPI